MYKLITCYYPSVQCRNTAERLLTSAFIFTINIARRRGEATEPEDEGKV